MAKVVGKASEGEEVERSGELGQLRQQVRTALDLAVVALAPTNLIDRLALAVGLLESLGELPSDSPPVIAMLPRAVGEAKISLDEWNEWHREHLGRRISSG